MSTSFGLISDKSAEIRGSEYWKNCQFSILAEIGHFHMLRMQISQVTSHACAKALFSEKVLCREGGMETVPNYQIFRP